MPKIIENIREKLLSEARRQVMEQGYSTMTIRSVASACGVGVGTVYNYFPSKDMLVASFMLEDWLKCVVAFTKACENAVIDNTSANITENPKAATSETSKEAVAKALHSIYKELSRFRDKYAVLFSDKNAGSSYASAFPLRHPQLRDQIAEALKPICARQNKAEPVFLADFIAESMLTWTMAGCEFEQIAGILLQLL